LQGVDEDYSEVINDPSFLQSVLEGLPGVDPQSEAIENIACSEFIQLIFVVKKCFFYYVFNMLTVMYPQW
jgi:hypothetical protein